MIPDNRGKIMHMLISDDDNFEKFGLNLLFTIYYNLLKLYHLHKEATHLYHCVSGNKNPFFI